MNWLHISLLLCLVGFLKEFRPSEPFFTDFAQQPYRNVTTEELNRNILPTGVYCCGFLSLIVLLVTDLLRYKPVIIVMSFSIVLNWGTLVWTRSSVNAQLSQVAFAMFATSEVAYFAYIYAKLPKKHYLEATSHARAAMMLGKFLSSMLGQILFMNQTLDLYGLGLISVIAGMGSTISAVCLPSVEQSIYFNRTKSPDNNKSNQNSGACTNQSTQNIVEAENYQNAFGLMWKQFICAYSNRKVVLWSIWYSAGFCGYLTIMDFVQLLWNAIDNRTEVIYNGAVESIATLLCAVIALLASKLHDTAINTKVKVLWTLIALSFGISASIFIMTNCGDRFVSYAGYIGFYMLYIFTITIASAEIAKQIPEDSYGLVFGVNTFVANWMQITISLIVATDIFDLELSIFNQFNVHGTFFAVLGLIYLILLLVDVLPIFHSRKTIQIFSVEHKK